MQSQLTYDATVEGVKRAVLELSGSGTLQEAVTESVRQAVTRFLENPSNALLSEVIAPAVQRAVSDHLFDHGWLPAR